MSNDPFAAVAPVTESVSGWTVTRLVPNVDNVVVGRNRKPRPFLAVRHAAKGCEDAYAIRQQMLDAGAREGTLRVEYNGDGVRFGFPGSPGHEGFAAMTAKVRAHQPLVRS
jgi:hypothetical protein